VNLLFLSRIERRKGIFELLTAFKMLRQHIKYKLNISLTICGDGFELDRIKSLVENEKIKGVTIEGFISGKKKKEAFEKSHMFIFPSHSEGMPNAVLEAMGFGLPVITTAVGGLNDFFIDGKHGAYILKNDANDLLEKLVNLIERPEMLKEISLTNHSLANERFRSDVVAKRMERKFEEVLKQ
jgi:glycosyltransferase involved in cell wall biosynthesis